MTNAAKLPLRLGIARWLESPLLVRYLAGLLDAWRAAQQASWLSSSEPAGQLLPSQTASPVAPSWLPAIFHIAI